MDSCSQCVSYRHYSEEAFFPFQLFCLCSSSASVKAAGPQFVMRCGFLEPGRQSVLKQAFLTVPPLPLQQDRLGMIRAVLRGWEPSHVATQLLQSQPKHPVSSARIFTLCFWQSPFRLTVLNAQTGRVQVDPCFV